MSASGGPATLPRHSAAPSPGTALDRREGSQIDGHDGERGASNYSRSSPWHFNDNANHKQ